MNIDFVFALAGGTLSGAAHAAVLKVIFGPRAVWVPMGAVFAAVCFSQYAPWWSLVGVGVIGQVALELYSRAYMRSRRPRLVVDNTK